MDYAFTDKSMESLGKGIKDILLKGLKNRTMGKSTEWTRTENLLEDSEAQRLNLMLEEEATRQIFKNKAQELSEGKITATQSDEFINTYENDPNIASYVKSFKTELKKIEIGKEMNVEMQQIKREKSPGARALMIKEIYGDINSPENAEIKSKLEENGVINDATFRYLEKKK
jgi:hypothetical protein